MENNKDIYQNKVMKILIIWRYDDILPILQIIRVHSIHVNNLLKRF